MVSGLIIAGIVAVGLLLLGLVFTKLYRKASKQMSFIRTGLGGEKIIMNGGAIVLPILHEIMYINMNTLKLEINKRREEALITKDRLRIDVTAEFYVRVAMDKDSVSKAAQTLGNKTLNPNELKALVEGKMVDVLRSVAAQMNMDELHEQRASFVQKVQTTLSDDLSKNGLELESVSLTGLNQTEIEYFNADNAFDAEGLKKLTESIQKNIKQKNDIEKDTALEIAKKNLEVEKESLNVQQAEAEARLTQEAEIAKRQAIQESEIAKEQATRRQEAETSKITAEQKIEAAKIEKEKALNEQEIEKQKAIQEKEIEKQKTLELAQQTKDIAIAVKSKESSEAQSIANRAKAEEVKSAQETITAEETEIANRNKVLEVIKAEEESQKITIKAQAEADAIKSIADATERKMEVEAEGNRKLFEAENGLTDEILAYRVKTALIQNLPGIIAAMTKPMEKIDSIKIVDMKGGLNGGTIAGQEDVSFPNQVVNAALKHKMSVPMVEDMLKGIGIGNLNDINSLVKGFETPVQEVLEAKEEVKQEGKEEVKQEGN